MRNKIFGILTLLVIVCWVIIACQQDVAIV